MIVRGARKAPVVGAFTNKQEEPMTKLLTHFELASRSERDLRALLRDLFNALARSDADSSERRNTLASLDNVRREISARQNLRL